MVLRFKAEVGGRSKDFSSYEAALDWACGRIKGYHGVEVRPDMVEHTRFKVKNLFGAYYNEDGTKKTTMVGRLLEFHNID